MQKFPSQHFSTQAPKNIKNPPRKKFLIFSEIELSSSNMQLSSSYIFLKESSYISRNETLYFSAQARKKEKKRKKKTTLRKFLVLQEMETPQKFRILFKSKLFLYFEKRSFFMFQERNI